MAETFTNPHDDLRARWLPSGAQIAAGVAALGTVPEADRTNWVAVVALAQPGKMYGIWETGQPVVPVPGVWVGENTNDDVVLPLSEARNAAETAAGAWLKHAGLAGTTGYALVYHDGNAAVFEGFPTD